MGIHVEVRGVAEIHAAPLEHAIQVPTPRCYDPIATAAIVATRCESGCVVQARGKLAAGGCIRAHRMNIDDAAHAVAEVYREAAGVDVGSADQRRIYGAEDALKVL